jgi:signal transduction histidine kinase
VAKTPSVRAIESVIVVQAQGGAAALGRHPDRTAEALQNVIATGRESLAEMRRLLDLVRRDPAVDPELTPQLGVGSLPELVDRVRAAGTPVSFAVEGEPVALPTSVELSAYRIAQEALTNTIKHAGAGARAAIRLGFQPNWLEIEVSDDGVGGSVSPGGDGTGLRGIAERIDILGGQLTVGPRESGGFRVCAYLPLGPAGAPA